MSVMVYGVLGAIILLVILLLGAGFVAIRVVRKRQQQDDGISLVSGGSDGSEFSRALAERYKNQSQ